MREDERERGDERGRRHGGGAHGSSESSAVAVRLRLRTTSSATFQHGGKMLTAQAARTSSATRGRSGGRGPVLTSCSSGRLHRQGSELANREDDGGSAGIIHDGARGRRGNVFSEAEVVSKKLQRPTVASQRKRASLQRKKRK
ncbi:hypothetical protein Scep_023773 [Stephania cephalantha]|uniref:Uncharacterized protein n=1 Tax=Stephania cephalantha TaxID=152367 RepID=A0AAP0F2F3_9MAGN